MATYHICRIPLARGTKKPLLSRWSSLPVDDPLWWETFVAHPNCGVGIRLDKLVVIDCDTPERVSWWLEQGFEQGCQTDFMTRGAIDHRSFWYRLPDDTDLRTSRYPGWEVRTGAGAHCTVPPSWHRSGRKYEWLGPEVDESTWLEIPEAPVDFLSGIRAAGSGGGIGMPGWSVIEIGGRESFLVATGGLWRAKGAGEDGIRAGLSMVNQAICHPPVTAEDIDRIARSLARYDTDLVFEETGSDPVKAYFEQ